MKTILLVEDNPITRKLVRFALEAEGLEVSEAVDGKTALARFAEAPVSLVLQDLFLPDMNGFELVAKLRALPRGQEVPVLAFTGMLSHKDEARVLAAGFDDLISKPIEPSRLWQIVRAHLPDEQREKAERFGEGLRLLVADDDPVQLKLVAFRMKKLGFQVATASDGMEALALAKREPPHAVLSDVLMPNLDGFRFCLELRRDPQLSKVPVVLTTNSYVEPADRAFAHKTGAHDLVLRTPELAEVFAALRSSLKAAPAPSGGGQPLSELEREHSQRTNAQLERQVAMTAGVNQRCALLSAELSVLKGISEALAGDEDIDAALQQTLAACFDAGGVSLGALYLKENGGLRLLSFGLSGHWSERELSDFFGERELLDGAIAGKNTLALPAAGGERGKRFLASAGLSSALLVPLRHRGASLGALVMLSRSDELESDDRKRFAEAVAGQISQALAVADAFRAKERSEREARERSAVLGSILDSIGDGVLVAEESGKYIHWNKAATPLVQLGEHESHGLFGADQTTRVPPAELPLARAMRGESVNGAELFARHAGAPAGVWLSVSSRPWRDEQGARRGGVAVFRDITQEKATQAQLLVSDRMASVGMLAAGVAHEINNPLASVVANIELSLNELQERAAAGELSGETELKDMLVDARDAAARVRQIVRDLKVFSRHEDTAAASADIETVIESTLRMARTELRHRARIVKEFGKVGTVRGADSRLSQVVLNLVVNAAQAIPEGDVEKNEIRLVTRVDANDRVIVEISDTGAGISPENLRQLFRPFFTTKAPGVGTGLGLAICQRIITGVGGEIQVQSEVGVGTTFRLILARAEATKPAAPVEATSSPRQLRRGRVLVVDDERGVGLATARTLSKEHEVTLLTEAREALDRIVAGATFDVILCDLMMPQMTGMDLHAELTRLKREQAERMIFLTGGAFSNAARDFLQRVPNLRVEKPFDGDQLRAVVRARVESSGE